MKLMFNSKNHMGYPALMTLFLLISCGKYDAKRDLYLAHYDGTYAVNSLRVSLPEDPNSVQDSELITQATPQALSAQGGIPQAYIKLSGSNASVFVDHYESELKRTCRISAAYRVKYPANRQVQLQFTGTINSKASDGTLACMTSSSPVLATLNEHLPNTYRVSAGFGSLNFLSYTTSSGYRVKVETEKK